VPFPNGVTGNIRVVPQQRVDPVHPLDSRAWACQEYLLSRRKLIFSQFELLVECREHPKRSLRDGILDYPYYRSTNDTLLALRREETMAKGWSGVLSDYTCRLLTDPEDRLSAFQGIADHIQSLHGRGVRFGIPTWWPESLAWSALSPNRVRSGRAPTWSWASLDGGVDGSVTRWLDLNPAVSPVLDSDPWGLTLSGKIIRGGDWAFERRATTSGDSRSVKPDLESGLPAQEDCIYLRLLHTDPEHHEYPADRDEVVLILESVGSDTYRRVGMYHGRVFHDHWEKQDAQLLTLI
jgi:hypothetical protein